MPDDPEKGKLPATASEIAELVKRIETLEGKKHASADEIAALKAELAELSKGAAPKPERKKDKWGWPIE